MGSASDAEDGNLTDSLVWKSELDEDIGSGGSFSAVLNEGTHTITASVTDSDGNTSSQFITITVGGGSGGDSITLTVTSKSNRNWVIVDLSWSGATSPSVDILKNEVILETTTNDGSYTDKIANTGTNSATYRICELDSSKCSNEETVNW